MKTKKSREHSGFRIINTLNEREYEVLHALLTSSIPTDANRVTEKTVEILDYTNLPAPLSSMHLDVVAYNTAASNVRAKFYGREHWSIDKEKYIIKPDEYMAAARAFASSKAVIERFRRSSDSLGVHLISRASGNAYIINRGDFLRESEEISTLPNFKKTDPVTLREDVETVLWLTEGLGAAFYQKVGRPVSLRLKTRNPSDFYSLPPEFYRQAE